MMTTTATSMAKPTNIFRIPAMQDHFCLAGTLVNTDGKAKNRALPSKLESQPSQDENPESKQTLERRGSWVWVGPVQI
jgi:hypothetical protein